MFVLALLSVIIAVFLVWYYRRTRRQLQIKYQEDITALRKENTESKAEYRELVSQEIKRWNEWAVAFTQANAKEQTERLEEVKRAYMEAIDDLKTSLTSQIKNSEFHWTNWTIALKGARESEMQYHEAQLKALEKKLTDMLSGVNENSVV